MEGDSSLKRERQSCETKPISPERPGMGAGCRVARPRRRAIVQNEPNAARPGQGPDRRKVRNEPNSAGRPELRRQKCAKRTQFPTENDTPPFQSDADGAKRSQTRRGRMGWGTRGDCAKRTQLSANGQERPSPRPEALTLPPIGGKRAKRSQFRLCRRNGAPLFALFIPSQVVRCAHRLRRAVAVARARHVRRGTSCETSVATVGRPDAHLLRSWLELIDYEK